jgi:two-component system nitrate/nitrite sensor histidine kinase NarX
VSSQLGFVPTLQEYLEEYRTSYGLDIQLLVGYTEIIELPQEMTNQLMRVIQEALTNVRKHANANKVRVHYHQDSNQICVQIEDDGQGFDPLHVQENGRQHVGLQIMKERMTSIRGSLNLVSQPGQGTRVILQVPVTFPNFKV